MTLTLGKKKCREGLNVCINYEFNLLHHVGVVAKRMRAVAAETAAHEGDDNTPFGPSGLRGKKQKMRFWWRISPCRARVKDCWPGCPLDYQVNFSGYPQDFLILRILGHKKTILIFQILQISLISHVGGLMSRAQNNLHIFVNLYQFLTSCPTETLRLILGCPMAKWVVSDAWNALISYPALKNSTRIKFKIC